jgi:hypothetical protein
MGQCLGLTNPSAKTVNGTFANVGATEQASVALANASASTTGAAGSAFTLQNVIDAAADVLATRSSFTISGTGVTITFNKGIIRRNQNPAAGSTMPVLDFNAAEAFTPVQRNLTINNLNGQTGIIALSYLTANRTSGLLYAETGGASTAARTYLGVPAANQVNGDLHLLTIAATNLSTTPGAVRNITTMFKDAADKTVTLGPALGTHAVTAASTAPYVRLRATYTVQPEYDDYFVFGASQTAGGISRSLTVSVTGAYQGTSTAFDFTQPDYTTVAGWNVIWGMVTGAQIGWTFNANGITGTSSGVGIPNAEGVVAMGAGDNGTINP